MPRTDYGRSHPVAVLAEFVAAADSVLSRSGLATQQSGSLPRHDAASLY
jgi:hypothetical protein